MTSLFDPIDLRGLKIRNRIWMPPMCQYMCAPDGLVTEWHKVHYGARAVGGAGLVIVEATGIVPEGRITPADLGLWNDDQIKSFLPLVSFIKAQGASIAIQLGHAGRKGSTLPPSEGEGGLPKTDSRAFEIGAPSALPFGPTYETPHAMTEEEIGKTVEAFRAASVRAVKAGFDAVEIHSAHGYLLHQFLSPLTNKREDSFGGSLENRMRFPLRVAEAVRGAVPNGMPVLVRLSATDWKEGGWDLEQTEVYCAALKERGIDLIDVSTGGLVPNAVIPVAPGFQVPFAEEIRYKTKIPTSAVGLITDPKQAEKLVYGGQADAVCIGRGLLRDPYWPLRAAHELDHEVPWPIPYLRGKYPRA